MHAHDSARVAGAGALNGGRRWNGRLRQIEHVSEDGRMVCQETPEYAKLDVSGDQDDVSIAVPELFVACSVGMRGAFCILTRTPSRVKSCSFPRYADSRHERQLLV